MWSCVGLNWQVFPALGSGHILMGWGWIFVRASAFVLHAYQPCTLNRSTPACKKGVNPRVSRCNDGYSTKCLRGNEEHHAALVTSVQTRCVSSDDAQMEARRARLWGSGVPALLGDECASLMRSSKLVTHFDEGPNHRVRSILPH